MNLDLSQHLLCIERILGKDCAFVCLSDQEHWICEILSKDEYKWIDIKKALAFKTSYLNNITVLPMNNGRSSIFYEKDHGFPGFICYAVPIYGKDDNVLYVLLAFCKQDVPREDMLYLMEAIAYCMARELIYAAKIKDLDQRNELLEKQKADFVDNILIFVHEIKNAISNLSACIQLLKHDMEGEDIEKVNRMLKKVAAINDIVGELVNWGKTNKLKLTKTCINQQVRNICDYVQNQAWIKGITLKVNTGDKPVYANIDTGMMNQVFLNIIDNAFAAMEQGGVLEITVKGDFERKTVSIIFKDNGCGIPEENMEKIFKLFFTTKSEGSGLGLSLCKNIVFGHGGTIEVDSQEGKGTTFIVNLPMVV